jgi:hypothetical protein
LRRFFERVCELFTSSSALLDLKWGEKKGLREEHVSHHDVSSNKQKNLHTVPSLVSSTYLRL